VLLSLGYGFSRRPSGGPGIPQMGVEGLRVANRSHGVLFCLSRRRLGVEHRVTRQGPFGRFPLAHARAGAWRSSSVELRGVGRAPTIVKGGLPQIRA
jgi:hypothetical protein